MVKMLHDDQWDDLVREVDCEYAVLITKRGGGSDIEDISGDEESDCGGALDLSELMNLDAGRRF